MHILSDLQNSIETLYDVSLNLDVTAYLIDDATRAEIPGAQTDIPEQLFAREVDDSVEIALYIDPLIINHLHHDNPQRCLHSGNLEPYCIALEGISHFVFLVWRANEGWSTTALELEIQAEVDKFITTWLLLSHQGYHLQSVADPLMQQLFTHYTLRNAVPNTEQERYIAATRAAKSFCEGLIKKYKQHGLKYAQEHIVSDARSYCRKSLACKLGRF